MRYNIAGALVYKPDFDMTPSDNKVKIQQELLTSTTLIQLYATLSLESSWQKIIATKTRRHKGITKKIIPTLV